MDNTKSLVLVVGAGASKEANLPVGDELKQKIARLLDIRFLDGYQQQSGDVWVMDALRRATAERGERDVNPLLHECWLIRDAMPQAISIDSFIESHRGNVRIAECGKLGIAKAILDAEGASLLGVDRNHTANTIRFEQLASSWYDRLFRQLSDGCDFAEYTARLAKVAIVSFNYDRCIEQFLFYATQNFYRVSPDEAARVIRDMEIFHPYGMVGGLPWMHANVSMPFGAEPSGGELLGLSRELRTFTEGTDPKRSDIVRLRSVVFSAHRIAFLGFAFHPLNMDLLLPADPAARSIRGPSVYATAFGISDSDALEVRTDLATRLDVQAGQITLRKDLTCVKLFDEYRRGFAIR